MKFIFRIVGMAVLLVILVVSRGWPRGAFIAGAVLVLFGLILLIAFIVNRARWSLRQQLKAQGLDAADVVFREDGRVEKGILAWGAKGIGLYDVGRESAVAPSPRIQLPWSEVAGVEAGPVPNELVIESVNRTTHTVEVVGLLGGALMGASEVFERALKRLKEAAALHP